MSVVLMLVRREPGLGPYIPLKYRPKRVNVEGLGADSRLVIYAYAGKELRSQAEVTRNGPKAVTIMPDVTRLRVELFGKDSNVSVWAE